MCIVASKFFFVNNNCDFSEIFKTKFIVQQIEKSLLNYEIDIRECKRLIENNIRVKTSMIINFAKELSIENSASTNIHDIIDQDANDLNNSLERSKQENIEQLNLKGSAERIVSPVTAKDERINQINKEVCKKNSFQNIRQLKDGQKYSNKRKANDSLPDIIPKK